MLQPEDEAVLAYLEEHHKIDLMMSSVVGDGLVVGAVIKAFRAGVAWQKEQNE